MSKVWFITGCSTGFGKEIALHALAQGDSVIATARNPDKIDIEGDVLKLQLDVTDQSQIERALQEGIAWKGKVDVLVNNAGFGNIGSIEETPDEHWKRLYDVNVFGLMHVTRAFLPHFKENKAGHIINFSSIAGLLTMPGFGPYCSTKYAVEGISEALAQEVGPLGIKVSIIEPGGFRTAFVGNVAEAPIGGEYAATVGETAKMLKNMETEAGGDPKKAAKVVYDVVQMEQAPLRLLLGSDAFEWGVPKVQAMVDDMKKNEQLTKSTDFN